MRDMMLRFWIMRDPEESKIARVGRAHLRAKAAAHFASGSNPLFRAMSAVRASFFRLGQVMGIARQPVLAIPPIDYKKAAQPPRYVVQGTKISSGCRTRG